LNFALKRPINSASCGGCFRIFDFNRIIDGPNVYGASSFFETNGSKFRQGCRRIAKSGTIA
jgi:hypothetical protein